jgi:AcrR family transcriptional regulator
MGRQKKYERSKVLEKAMKLFWRKGYEGTHLQELVKVTGVNRFGLYKEFGGKGGLFDEAMELYLSQLSKTITPLLREPMGIENILDYFDELEMDFFLHGCFMTNSLTEKNVVEKKSYKKMIKTIDGFQGLLRKNLLAAQKAGKLNSKRSLDPLIKFLAVIDLGIVIHGINAAPGDKDEIVAQLKSFILTMTN